MNCIAAGEKTDEVAPDADTLNEECYLMSGIFVEDSFCNGKTCINSDEPFNLISGFSNESKGLPMK